MPRTWSGRPSSFLTSFLPSVWSPEAAAKRETDEPREDLNASDPWTLSFFPPARKESFVFDDDEPCALSFFFVEEIVIPVRAILTLRRSSSENEGSPWVQEKVFLIPSAWIEGRLGFEELAFAAGRAA